MDEVIDQLKAKGIRTTVVTHKGQLTYTWDDKTESYLGGEESILLEDEYKDLTEKTDGKIIDLTTDFAAELNEYASEIIAKTAGTEVPDDYVGVTGVELGDDVSIPTDSVYNYPVTVKPVNATNKVIYWSVEDESIATINTELTDEKHCVVNALKPGTTKLIAKSADGGYTAYFTITIADVVSKDDSSVTTKVDKVVDILSDTESKTTKAVLRSSEDKTEIDADTLKDIFVATKDNNKEMEFNFVDEEGDDLYSWTFKGENITDASKTITTFKINPDAASKDLEGKDADAVKKVEEGLAAVKAAEDSEIIHFRHEGELPGKAEIKVKVGFDDADDMGLYYFNPETGKFELVNAKVIVKDGYATFEIAHCSDYVLSKVDLTKTAETETKATETVAGAEETKAETTTAAKDASIPKTGDNAAPAAAALAAVMSAAAGAVAAAFAKRRALEQAADAEDDFEDEQETSSQPEKKEVHEDFISWEATSEEETAEVPEDEDSAENPAEKDSDEDSADAEETDEEAVDNALEEAEKIANEFEEDLAEAKEEQDKEEASIHID